MKPAFTKSTRIYAEFVMATEDARSRPLFFFAHPIKNASRILPNPMVLMFLAVEHPAK